MSMDRLLLVSKCDTVLTAASLRPKDHLTAVLRAVTPFAAGVPVEGPGRAELRRKRASYRDRGMY